LDCHPEQAFFAQVKDLGEPREASRSLRGNNRAFGSLPYQTAPLPVSTKDLLLQIQSDTRGWLGTAYEHVSGNGKNQSGG
jgi:hypothetical protein